MSLDTYANLKTAIQDWINKSYISGTADDLIDLAEAEFNKTLRVQPMMVYATGSISSNPTSLSSEFTRLKRIKSLAIVSSSVDIVLNYISNDLFFSRYPATSTGIPEYYTLVGDSLYLDPAPSGTFTYKCMYYQGINPLSDSNTTNWLLTSHPDIYLNTCLKYGAEYAKDPEAAGMYAQLAMNAIRLLKEMDKRDRVGGTAKMIPEVRAI